MLVTHGQSSMRRTEFLTSHQTCASGSQRELSASCLSPWQRGEDWAGGWTGREKKPKGRKEVSRRQGYSQQSTPLMGRTIPGPLSCSGRNPWQFPGSVLQVQSCHCVCAPALPCPEHSSPPSTSSTKSSQSFTTQHNHVACVLDTPPGLFLHNLVRFGFKLQGWDVPRWGSVLREGEQQKNGDVATAGYGNTSEMLSPQSCHLCHLIYWAAPCPFQDNSGWQLLSARPGSSFIKAPRSLCQFILLPTDSFSI